MQYNQELQYFVGKICSVITTSMNRAFDERICREHFVVQVNDIGRAGIWGKHPYNLTLSFFSMEHIISIHEEIVLNPKNPEHAAMIEEFEKKTGQTLKGDVAKNELLSVKEESPETSSEDSIFVDIKNLEQLAERTKKALDVNNDVKLVSLTGIG